MSFFGKTSLYGAASLAKCLGGVFVNLEYGYVSNMVFSRLDRAFLASAYVTALRPAAAGFTWKANTEQILSYLLSAWRVYMGGGILGFAGQTRQMWLSINCPTRPKCFSLLRVRLCALVRWPCSQHAQRAKLGGLSASIIASRAVCHCRYLRLSVCVLMANKGPGW